MEKYWLVITPEGENYRREKAHIIFGNIQELIEYATSQDELILAAYDIKEDFLSEFYYANVLGLDGEKHPEILKIIERKLYEARERIENSPFKKLKGLFKK